MNVVQTAPRHFLGLLDHSTGDLRRILALAETMKKARVRGEPPKARPLAGKTLAMIFERPSTRTRVSFDVAMRELGGETIMLTGAEMQLGRGETIADTARVLSRFVEAIIIRILNRGRSDRRCRRMPPSRSSTGSPNSPIPVRCWPTS